jgi:hypothetical protein
LSTELIPLIVTVLTIFGAALTYAYQRIVDRKTALVELRRNAYREFVSSFLAGFIDTDSAKEKSMLFHSLQTDLLIVGSDEVIRKVGALCKYFQETNHDRFSRDAAMGRRFLADVCLAMRADCFEKSALSIEEIEPLVPLS